MDIMTDKYFQLHNEIFIFRPDTHEVFRVDAQHSERLDQPEMRRMVRLQAQEITRQQAEEAAPTLVKGMRCLTS
jgi:hypothetical protein